MGNAAWKLLFLSLVLLCVTDRIQAQGVESNITGYSCSDGDNPCKTYAFYKAHGPYHLNLRNISDLFGVSRLEIARASDLPVDTNSLTEGQSLLVPIKCGCKGNYSQANIAYKIQSDNTLYLVSTKYFGYLTTYRAVEVANPSLNPEDLPIGVMVIFPIRCQCPSKALSKKGINMQITYVVQQADTLESISKKFGANLTDLKSQNGMPSTLFSNTTLLVPVSKKPTLA